jgi:hypothetical protein
VRLTREPLAVRFQARYSNDLRQFDLSPSELKHVKAPRWGNDSKGEPPLMLYPVQTNTLVAPHLTVVNDVMSDVTLKAR